MPSPVSYPALRINGNEYQFRFTRTTEFLMDIWGLEWRGGKMVNSLAWAAAMAGTVDSTGAFHSARFKHPTEFTDQLGLGDDLDPIQNAVTEALKKVAPKATLTLVPSPALGSASTEPQPET